MTPPQRPRTLPLLLGPLALMVLQPLPAKAFHQAHGGASGNGPVIWWKQMPVTFSLQARCALGDDPNALNPEVQDAGEDEQTFNQLCHAAIQRSFDSWQTPSCTKLRFNQLPDTPIREVGYDPSAGSANLNTVQFMLTSCDQTVDATDPCWQESNCDGKYGCFGHGSAVVALTSTVADPGDGHLLDADIEGNAADFHFSAEAGAPLDGTIDIQNTFTHEAGHFIGLAHSCESDQSCPGDLLDTTMYWQQTDPQETTKRTLKQDDINGLCSIYPLGGGVTAGGCQTGTAGGSLDPLAPLILLLTGLSLRAKNRSSAGIRMKIPLP